jgi:NTE family protein
MVFLEGGKMYDNLTTIEAGQTPFDGTMAVVARTSLGPIYIGGSIGDSGHRKWWFGLRHVF